MKETTYVEKHTEPNRIDTVVLDSHTHSVMHTRTLTHTYTEKKIAHMLWLRFGSLRFFRSMSRVLFLFDFMFWHVSLPFNYVPYV